MSTPMASISIVERVHPITLLTFSSDKVFELVISDFEKQLGRFDEAKAVASNNLESAVREMVGPIGLMIINVLQMDQILPALASSSKRVRQYLVGNPLIASKMAQHNVLAALYAPPRVLIYTGEGNTWISYDKPSSTFGTLSSPQIDETAKDLDKKFEQLAKTALS